MLSEIFQSIGLILDVIGVILIVKFFKKITYKETSPFGLISNITELLTEVANSGRTGSYFLVLGFIFQLIGLWIDSIILLFKGVFF